MCNLKISIYLSKLCFSYENTFFRMYNLNKNIITPRSWSGYNDELCWGAAWLYKATQDPVYKSKAESYISKLGGSQEFSWDDKAIGCYVSIRLYFGYIS